MQSISWRLFSTLSAKLILPIIKTICCMRSRTGKSPMAKKKRAAYPPVKWERQVASELLGLRMNLEQLRSKIGVMKKIVAQMPGYVCPKKKDTETDAG